MDKQPDRNGEIFALKALDFEELRAVLERHAGSSLGLAAVRALLPRKFAEARSALSRSAEMIAIARQGLAPSTAGLFDPRTSLSHARKVNRPLSENELVELVGFLQAAERLCAWLQARREDAPALHALCAQLPDPKPLRERVLSVVDEEGRVRDSASPTLARLRKQEAELAKDIDRTLRLILARSEVRTILSDQNPMRRSGRSVLAVKAKNSGRLPGIIHDRSQTGETVFVEPREIVMAGNRIAEIEADSRRELERVLLELLRWMLGEEASFRRLAEGLGELELALVAARWASECGGRIPLLPGDKGAAGGLLLREARHPLLVEEKRQGRLADVVPIDLRLGCEFDVLIVTGPNTGGKTLALKTVGLFAVCTRMGLPFPCAQGSTAVLYDGIVADIGDEQEIRQSLSTFSSHLKRIREGLARASEATLVLLDELGSGTDPDEGAALSEALLEQFLKRRSHTLVSTHIGKLKEFAFRHPRAENACVAFDAQTLAPQYQIQIGAPGESGALVIARRLGLDGAIVERARERLVRRDAELAQLMKDMSHARKEAEKARSEAEARLVATEQAREEVEQKKRALAQKSEQLEIEAQRSVEDRVREAMRLVERGRNLLEQVPADKRGELSVVLSALEAELSGSALSDRRQAFLEGLKKGSFVYLPRYKQRVPVLKVDAADREVHVQLGAMKMRVSFDEISAWEGR
jgi:DNA mismatch repair protein MutS2